MTTSAPKMRTVCQLTGEVSRPSVFFKALAAADVNGRELERLREENRELKTRVEELEAALENSVDLAELADAVGKGCTK